MLEGDRCRKEGRREGGRERGNGTVEGVGAGGGEAGGPGRTDNEAMRFEERHCVRRPADEKRSRRKGILEVFSLKYPGFKSRFYLLQVTMRVRRCRESTRN